MGGVINLPTAIMDTIILDEPRHFSFTDTPLPDGVPDGQALVRVHRIGICGTDLHAYQGRQTFFMYPRVLGHELGVEVTGVSPNDRGIFEGDFCAVEPFLNCGKCVACRRGKPNCCTGMQVLGVHTDGGMRDYITVPIEKLHKSESLTLDQLAMVEPLSIGAHSMRRARVEEGENTLIIGVGPIGLTAAASARAAGANVIVTDISEARLSFCREAMEIDRWIDNDKDVAGQLKDFCEGELPTAVFDCTGNPRSMAESFTRVAHGGRLIFIGHFPGEITFDDANFHMRELTLMASRNAAPEDFEHVLALLEKGEIDVAPWITHRVPREAVIESFPGWLDPESGVVKAVVEWIRSE